MVYLLCSAGTFWESGWAEQGSDNVGDVRRWHSCVTMDQGVWCCRDIYDFCQRTIQLNMPVSVVDFFCSMWHMITYCRLRTSLYVIFMVLIIIWNRNNVQTLVEEILLMTANWAILCLLSHGFIYVAQRESQNP